MIRPDDRMTISDALQDYEKQKSNYHFYNWELAELERCEKEIKNVVKSYEENISDLAQLISEFPSLTEYISKEKLEEIKNEFSAKAEEEDVFYSLNGEKHSTIEEALAMNEQLISVMQSKTR